MKNILIIWIFTLLPCFATNTNIDYAAIPAEHAEEDAPNMILSAETNFLKSGVWINNSNHVLVVQNGQMVSQATLAMLNMSTNLSHFWWFWPSTELQYQIKLVDDDGHIVPKTSYGNKFGRPPKRNPDNVWVIDAQKYGLHIAGVLPKGDTLHEFSVYDPVQFLPKCFEMEKPGNYKLTLIHDIYVAERRTNGVFLKQITFSPVTVNVRVEK